jgi:hypothetical protein
VIRRLFEEANMRFMMIVKASEKSEAGVLPTQSELEEMAKYNETLLKAGVMLEGTGLAASSKGARVRYQGKERSVVDGPFAEAKELIAGYWLIQVKSKAEAVEWARRVPFTEGEVEIRQLHELEDFGPGEGVEHHREIQKQLAQKK